MSAAASEKPTGRHCPHCGGPLDVAIFAVRSGVKGADVPCERCGGQVRVDFNGQQSFADYWICTALPTSGTL